MVAVPPVPVSVAMGGVLVAVRMTVVTEQGIGIELVSGSLASRPVPSPRLRARRPSERKAQDGAEREQSMDTGFQRTLHSVEQNVPRQLVRLTARPSG